MGASRPKGAPKTPGSGRKKGVKNKRSQLAEDKAKELGVDPFEILLLFAAGDWKRLGYSSATREVPAGRGTVVIDTIEPHERRAAASDACKYLHPTLKSVDFKSSSPGAIEPRIVYIAEWGSKVEAGTNGGADEDGNAD